MKLSLIYLSIILSFPEIVHAQQVYYPLTIGNKWEYEAPIPSGSWGLNGQLSKVIKDTVITGKTYAVIAHSDSILGETRYERIESNKVFRFNLQTQKEELWFDFTLNPGETVNRIYKNDDTLTITFINKFEQVVLDKVRNLWKFGVYSSLQFYLWEIEIADSIGIIKYPSDDPELIMDSIFIRGAVIDSVLYRTSYPSINLPLQPGNWWKLVGALGTFQYSIVKDSIMPNGKKYAMFQGNQFMRQEDNYVYLYSDGNEEIEMDLSAPQEQVYEFQLHTDEEFPYILRWISFGISNKSVFSKMKQVYEYGTNPFPLMDASSGYAYADSIGIIRYIENPNGIPAVFGLDQNYPNPFNPTTSITYSIPIAGTVSLKIYDILGREIELLVNGFMSAGEHKVVFNASNLSSGIYFYELKAGNYRAVKKMLLLK